MNMCWRSEVRLTRDEQWNLVPPWELKVRTESDPPATRQKHFTNQTFLVQAHYARGALCAQECTHQRSVRGSRPVGPENLQRQIVQAADSVLSGPDVKEREPSEVTEAVEQPVVMEGGSADQVVGS